LEQYLSAPDVARRDVYAITGISTIIVVRVTTATSPTASTAATNDSSPSWTLPRSSVQCVLSGIFFEFLLSSRFVPVVLQVKCDSTKLSNIILSYNRELAVEEVVAEVVVVVVVQGISTATTVENQDTTHRTAGMHLTEAT
jgi:hypothetical protein